MVNRSGSGPMEPGGIRPISPARVIALRKMLRGTCPLCDRNGIQARKDLMREDYRALLALEARRRGFTNVKLADKVFGLRKDLSKHLKNRKNETSRVSQEGLRRLNKLLKGQGFVVCGVHRNEIETARQKATKSKRKGKVGSPRPSSVDVAVDRAPAPAVEGYSIEDVMDALKKGLEGRPRSDWDVLISGLEKWRPAR
jgi:hypothetical protein